MLLNGVGQGCSRAPDKAVCKGLEVSLAAQSLFQVILMHRDNLVNDWWQRLCFSILEVVLDYCKG